jgi:hypothetical protein
VTDTATATNDHGSTPTASATTKVTNPSTPPKVSAPKATTGASSAITKTSAKLAGAVSTGGQSTVYLFEYGKTTAYGMATNSTPPARRSAQSNAPDEGHAQANKHRK